MARVLIECPVTLHQVWTRMEMDQQDFDSATIADESFLCPACGQTHSWEKADASLEERGPG